MRPLRRSQLPMALLAGLLITACTGTTRQAKLPTPSTSAPATTTTSPAEIDTSGDDLAPVPGRTTTSIDNAPGKASLAGVVAGPEGSVAQATVRVQRLVGDTVLAKDVQAGPDGIWRLDLVKGGRYRVRAWRAPDLAQIDPQVFFLRGDEVRSLDLTLLRFSGEQPTAAVNPNPPEAGAGTNLAVKIANTMVDPQGVVRRTPQPGVSVQLLSGANWRVDTPNPQISDSTGQARWQLICRQAGDALLSVSISSAPAVPITVPACQDPVGASFPNPISPAPVPGPLPPPIPPPIPGRRTTTTLF